MAKKPPARKTGKGGGDRWIVVGIVICLVVIALALWGPLRKFRAPAEKRPVPHAKQEEPAVISKPPSRKPSAATGTPKSDAGPALLGSAAPGKTVMVAIVIDDLGRDVKQAKEIGLNAIFLGGDGAMDQKLVEIAGPSAEGFYMTFTPDPANIESVPPSMSTEPCGDTMFLQRCWPSGSWGKGPPTTTGVQLPSWSGFNFGELLPKASS